MTNCIKCGANITSDQYQNFSVMCPECVRLQPIQADLEAQRKNRKICWILIIIAILSGPIAILIMNLR